MTTPVLHIGDCIVVMASLDAESIDAIVCDPPYGIGFMGHEWDQPGDYGPVSRNGTPAPFGRSADLKAERQARRSQRRATQRGPSSGAGHARARAAAAAGEDVPPDAMSAGRYDLSPTANRRFQAWCEAWASEALRVLKPGGHMLVFGSTRTHHRLAAGIEDAGFEIRDTLAWMFGSGFPKSLNVSKAIDRAAGAERDVVGERLEHDIRRPEGGGDERLMTSAGQRETTVVQITTPATPEAIAWDGWGTALKPGYEPILLARKPLIGTVTANVLQHGTGALNIAGCRIDVDDQDYERNHSGDRGHGGTRPHGEITDLRPGGGSASDQGRWPANVVLDETAAAMLDDQTGELTSGANPTRRDADKFREAYGDFKAQEACPAARGVDVGGASRFYYVAKADATERHAGLGHDVGLFSPADAPERNDHPTVKPIAVMRWLLRLVTPPHGVILDPFTGSGTTGCAAVLEGLTFVGIERDEDYAAIARARITHWSSGRAVTTETAA